MKLNYKNLLIAAVLVLALSVGAFAQTNVVPTTLTTAISNTDTNLVVASTTGMVASATGAATFILIDKDLMQVTAVPSSTTLTVRRQTGSTNPVRHAAGVYVVYGTTGNWSPTAVGSPTTGVFLGASTRPTGSCTLSSQAFSPVLIRRQVRYSRVMVLSGRWVTGPLQVTIRPWLRYVSA